MAHVPSLPPELVSIVARFLEPSAWSTARALSKAYRDAVHERTKDPAALGELIWQMQLRECNPLYMNYGRDPQKELLERHFPTHDHSEPRHHGFVRLSMKLMLDLAEYFAYDRAQHYNEHHARELSRDNILYIESRADVDKWMVEVMRPYVQRLDMASQTIVDAVLDEPSLWSTLRWVMLRMVDRVRFGHFYFERSHGPGICGTQLMPLIWEMR